MAYQLVDKNQNLPLACWLDIKLKTTFQEAAAMSSSTGNSNNNQSNCNRDSHNNTNSGTSGTYTRNTSAGRGRGECSNMEWWLRTLDGVIDLAQSELRSLGKLGVLISSFFFVFHNTAATNTFLF